MDCTVTPGRFVACAQNPAPLPAAFRHPEEKNPHLPIQLHVDSDLFCRSRHAPVQRLSRRKNLCRTGCSIKYQLFHSLPVICQTTQKNQPCPLKHPLQIQPANCRFIYCSVFSGSISPPSCRHSGQGRHPASTWKPPLPPV